MSQTFSLWHGFFLRLVMILELRFLLDSVVIWFNGRPIVIQNENQRQSAQFLLVARALQNFGETSLQEDPRREHQRIPRSLSISIQPLNDDFQPDGEPFWLVSRDISLAGIGLISPEPVIHRHVRLGLMDETVSVIGEVRHNSSIGTYHPLYLVGVEYIT